MTNDKDDIKKFLDKLDNMVLEMENHPKLSNYFIGVVDQLKNFSVAIKTDNKIPHNDWFFINLYNILEILNYE